MAADIELLRAAGSQGTAAGRSLQRKHVPACTSSVTLTELARPTTPRRAEQMWGMQRFPTPTTRTTSDRQQPFLQAPSEVMKPKAWHSERKVQWPSRAADSPCTAGNPCRPCHFRHFRPCTWTSPSFAKGPQHPRNTVCECPLLRPCSLPAYRSSLDSLHPWFRMQTQRRPIHLRFSLATELSESTTQTGETRCFSKLNESPDTQRIFYIFSIGS